MITVIDGGQDFDKKHLVKKCSNVMRSLGMTGDITIKIGDRKESESLNSKYRNLKYPTDVLSFSINEEFPESFYIGDIFVCYPIAEEQSVPNNHSTDTELFVLSCHGILHLAGYDHENDSGEMLSLQDELVKKYSEI